MRFGFNLRSSSSKKRNRIENSKISDFENLKIREKKREIPKSEEIEVESNVEATTDFKKILWNDLGSNANICSF